MKDLERHNKLKDKLWKLAEAYPQEYKDKLKEEITWIRLAKLEPRILTDIENNISGRDNPNGLVFAYLLGFTNIDPIKANIDHSYTVNPDCPDIDCDIDSIHQQKMEGHLKDVYGEDKVAHVATFMEWGPKSILKDLCRILKIQIPFKENNILSDLLGDEDDIDKAWSNAKDNAPKDDNMRNCIEVLDPYITKWGKLMVGMIRQIGQHAAGIVITPEKVSDMIPTINKSGVILTGIPEGQAKRQLTDVGILKGDFLGLATCSIVAEALKLIGDPNLDIDKIDLEDPKVLERFALGDTECIFQFSSPGMIKLLKDIEVSCFNDISAALSIFRPGPLNAGLDKAYIEGKRNPESIKWLHEDMKDVLGETYGQLIYQEQQMDSLIALAGFTGAEADASRKMFKKLSNMTKEEIKKDEAFSSMLNRIEIKCKEKGIPRDEIHDFIEQLKAFSGYSFNKSHSYSYAFQSYGAMWLRVYYPQQFYCAVYNTPKSNFDINTYKRLAAKDGVETLPPDLTKSIENMYKIEGNNIRSGLYLIDGFSENTPRLKRLIKPNDHYDFFDNIMESGWNKSQVETAIFSGCLDSAFSNLKQLHVMYLDWNDTIKAKFKSMSERSYNNYLAAMVELGFSELERKALELVAKNIKLKKEAKSFLDSKLTINQDSFDIFWKKYRPKFAKQGDKAKHKEAIAKLLDKHKDVIDFTPEEKQRLKTSKVGFDENIMLQYSDQICEYAKTYPEAMFYNAGIQSSFNQDNNEYFTSTPMPFCGVVSSMKRSKVGKGDKQWENIKVVLTSQEGSIECGLIDWEPDKYKQIPIIENFMEVGDLVVLALKMNKLEFIDICPLKTRYGLASNNSLIANFTKGVINNPYSPPPYEELGAQLSFG